MVACAFALLSVLASSSSRAAVAVLPADAPGLLPGAREALDTGIHAAVVAAGIDVQPQARTARFIKDAVEAGLDCSLVDDECAQRAGVAAGADGVLVPQVRRVGDRTVVVLRWLVLEQPVRAAAAALDDTDVAGSLLALAKRLQDPTAAPATALPVPLAIVPRDNAHVLVDGADVVPQQLGGGDDVVWLTPGTHTIAVSAPGYAAVDVIVPVPADKLLEPQRITLVKGFPVLAGAGIGTAIVGGVLLVGGGVGAGICEALLSGPQAPETRAGIATTGRVFVGAAIAGAVVAAAGGTLIVVGLSE